MSFALARLTKVQEYGLYDILTENVQQNSKVSKGSVRKKREAVEKGEQYFLDIFYYHFNFETKIVKFNTNFIDDIWWDLVDIFDTLVY